MRFETKACPLVPFQVWQLGSSSPNFTLEGHEKGVNCIDYYSGGDKPYLISGADDRLVKIWDYQVRASCLRCFPCAFSRLSSQSSRLFSLSGSAIFFPASE